MSCPFETWLPAVERRESDESLQKLLGFDDHMLGSVVLVDQVDVQLVGSF